MNIATMELSGRDRWNDFKELAKSGITIMIVVSTAVGFLLAAVESQPWTLWLHTLLGTALVSSGSSALNQVVERRFDAQMKRVIPGQSRSLVTRRLKTKWT